MPSKSPDPQHVATWRYEQIQEALNEDLSHPARGQIIRRISKTPVKWPSGQTKRLRAPTVYRWIRAFVHGGLAALRPKRRSDYGVSRQALPDEVVTEALRLLTEDPGLSFTFLLALLQPKYPDRTLCRSTLQERLSAHPDYNRIKRLRRHTQRRTRFVAQAAHDVWHTDAKGPITVRLTSGETLQFHIFSILDDASRAILAARVCLRANLAAAVIVFRMAALRWGLPKCLYADRASIFDCPPFRSGLAQLGGHRIRTKPRNPEANGKIEAYHRIIVRWFVKRLPKQQVIDAHHLQLLLDGVIYGLYQPHRHRGLNASPHAALAENISDRVVPPTRLFEAFRQEKDKKAHRKTGEVDIDGVTYLVPDELRGQRLTFLIDPPNEVPPLLRHPTSGKHVPLRRAAIKPADLDAGATPTVPQVPWGSGHLQTLYDTWQGKTRPLAEPGFGLPELYTLLGHACGRYVPQSDAEAALVQRVYADIGPLPKTATETALAQIAKQLGPQRPLSAYLESLAQRVSKTTGKEDVR